MIIFWFVYDFVMEPICGEKASAAPQEMNRAISREYLSSMLSSKWFRCMHVWLSSSTYE